MSSLNFTVSSSSSTSYFEPTSTLSSYISLSSSIYSPIPTLIDNPNTPLPFDITTAILIFLGIFIWSFLIILFISCCYRKKIIHQNINQIPQQHQPFVVKF